MKNELIISTTNKNRTEITKLKDEINERYGDSSYYFKALKFALDYIKNKGLPENIETIIVDFETELTAKSILCLTQKDIDRNCVTKSALKDLPIGLLKADLDLSKALKQ